MAAKRITITIEEEWVEPIRREAKRRGMTLSSWLARLGYEHLPKKVAKSLPDAKPRGRQPLNGDK